MTPKCEGPQLPNVGILWMLRIIISAA